METAERRCDACGRAWERWEPPLTGWDDLRACSPCRAEHAGEVELRLPEDASLGDLTSRLFVAARLQAIHGAGAREALRRWGEALDTAARKVWLLRFLLERGGSDAEAVAHLLMSTGADSGIVLRSGRRDTLRLCGLPGPLARRLAAECPEVAVGPDLTRDEMHRLARAPDRRP